MLAQVVVWFHSSGCWRAVFRGKVVESCLNRRGCCLALFAWRVSTARSAFKEAS